MVSERNRILELTEYFSSLGINVNIGKTKARGHKGIFMHSPKDFRIDIAKNIDESSTISTLLHEFAHFVHYSYDKSLKSLDFVFDEFSEDIREELINITVQDIPKEFASELYNTKDCLNNDIKKLTQIIKTDYPEFKLSEKNKDIEKNLSLPIKYLLKYDNIKYFNRLFSVKNIDDYLDLSDTQKTYIKLKSKQRALKRINSKINRLNKYYNNYSELFARFIDAYYTKPNLTKKIAPKAFYKLQCANIKLFDKVNKIFN